LLLQVRQTVSEADENQNYPVEVISDQLGMPFSTQESESPLFDVMSLLENIHDYDYVRHIKSNMVFSFMRTEETIDGILEFNKLLYDRSTIERIISHFRQVLQRVLTNPDIKLSDVDVMTEQEKRQVLFDFNDTATAYPKGQTIQALFQEQVERNPQNTALIGPALSNARDKGTGVVKMERISLTYSQLSHEIHDLAALLVQKGVGPDTIVGLLAQRSLEMIIAIFAILKAGGAYLPIEPQSPDARKLYMLRDSSAGILLTTRGLSEEVEKLKVNRTEVDELKVEKLSGPGPEKSEDLPFETIFIDAGISVGARLAPAHDSSVLPPLHPESDPTSNLSTLDSAAGPLTAPRAAGLAYIIYTSGSTGKPKGVVVEHRAVVNILTALHRDYPLRENDTFLFKTSYLFDVSVAELFGWFLEGGRLAVLQRGGEKDPQIIIAAIEQFAVTHINFVPSMFNVFVDGLSADNIVKLSPLKYIFLAGEVLLPESVCIPQTTPCRVGRVTALFPSANPCGTSGFLF